MKLHIRVSFLLLGLALLADTAVRADPTANPAGSNTAVQPTTTASTTATPKSATTTTTPTPVAEQQNSGTKTHSSTPSTTTGGNATTSETANATSETAIATSEQAHATSEQTSPADTSTGTSTTTAKPVASTATNIGSTKKKETGANATTLSTAAGTTGSGKTDNANSSATSATPAGNETSPVPGSTSKAPVATTTNTTVKPTSTSPSTHQTTVPAPASTPSNTTLGTPTTTSTASTTPPTSSVIISETNLLLARDSFFVELKGATSASLNNLTLAVFDANTTEVAYYITYNSTTVLNATTSLYVQPIDETFQNLVSVAVVLYQPKSYMGKFTDTGLQDYVVFSLKPNAIARNIKEALLKDAAATIVRKGLTASDSTPLSLSRCTDIPKDSSVFFATRQSCGRANDCPLLPSSRQLMLQLHLKDKNCVPSAGDTDSIKQKLQKKLVSEINQRCGCGLSTRQIKSNLTCARDLYLEFKVSPSFDNQAEKFTTAFRSYVQNPNNTQRFDEQYKLVSCWQDCRKSSPHHPPGSKKNNNGNIGVTVAVVLSCIAVFLLILVAVIIYMRRKRHGIMRQFRMTRLQEDDDMDDMDDFIGGGFEQEPSFNSSRNNLTS